jgi:CDP-diacylglycerol--glycerol-3-phosphate 3-phosphatidyltransferase
MIEGFKPFYNAALYPLAKLFTRTSIHPNAISSTGVLLSCVACYYAATGQWIVAALLVAAGSCLDGLDGLLARTAGKTTVFGAVFDSVCDRFTEFAWTFGILVFYMHHHLYRGLGVYSTFLAMSGSIMVSYMRARCEAAGIPCSRGMLQRPERIIMLIASFLCGPRIMIGGLLLISALAYITVIERIYIAFSASARDGAAKH